MNELAPFKQLVYDYAGLLLEGKVAEQRLQQHLQQTGQRLGLDTTRLLELLRQSRASLDKLISQLTVNETYFFREPEHINLFVQKLLPRLLEQADNRPVRILSAGCSSGEEPYSLAMAILESHGAPVLQRVSIAAGDVDQSILAKAREALYSPFSFRGTDDGIRNRYFTKDSKGYRLVDAVRQQVSFFELNLMGTEYPGDKGPYDAIFFRNVSIYFDEATRENIQHRFSRIMQPDAVLLIGSTETMGNDFGIFQLCESRGLYYFVKGSKLLPAKPVRARQAPGRPVPAQATAPISQPPAPRPATQPDQSTLPDPELIKQLLQEERYNEADSKLQLLLSAGQHEQEARLMQAWLWLNTGDLSAAGRQLDQLLQDDPWNLDALLARGLCSKWQDDPDNAITVFKAACYAHAGSWLAQYFYGDILRQGNNPASARGPLQVARRILSANIDSPDGCNWLPLALPARDALLLIERQLLALKSAQTANAATES